MKPTNADKPFEFMDPSAPPEATDVQGRQRTGRRNGDQPFEFMNTFTPTTDEAPPREFDFVQIANQYKWFLLMGLLGGLALGQVAFNRLGPEYNAVAQILVSRQAQVPARESLTQSLQSEGRGEHVAVIDSPLIVGEAIERGKLNELPTLQRSSDPVEDILEGLDVKRTAGQDNSTLNVIEIKYRNKQPADARAVVNAIIAAYDDYLAESPKSASNKLSRQISQMNDELEKKIEQKQGELLEFRKDAPLLWRTAPGDKRQPGDVTNVHQERALAIERDRTINVLRRVEINGKLQALQAAIDQGQSHEELESVVRLLIATSQAAGGGQAAAGANGPNALLGGPNPVELAANQLLPLLIEEQKLLRDYSDDHPDVVNVRRSIAKLKEFYQARGVSLTELTGRDGKGQKIDVVAGYMQFLKQQLEELDHRDAEMAKLYNSETRAVKDITKFMVDDQYLSDELERLKAQWNAIVSNVSQLDMTRDSQDYSMKLLAPVREEWSLKRYLKIVGAATGFVLAIFGGIIFLRELRDTTIKSLTDIRKLIDGAQVLGSVPQFDAGLVEFDPDLPLQPSLCYFHRPGSVEAEAYRNVRTALFVGLNPKQKVIQVSSPEPGDGKSTFISNLAIALAQSGKRVLLLDADLRRPTIHRLFHARQELGTTDVLSGEIQLINAVQECPVPNLWLLTAGFSPSNPAETLSSPRFDSLLTEARREFDFVLVDSPPLLVVSDPCI
ncbi:MAG: polysaccharide biosynthesis tyrosine autokinase, partial [Planctomycetaceae bacterium]|nr:polysaccharide biosynthesis tyrosine autokinase [Planctomycetaceae bacterium]